MGSVVRETQRFIQHRGFYNTEVSTTQRNADIGRAVRETQRFLQHRGFYNTEER
jgi:hypothetical protein